MKFGKVLGYACTMFLFTCLIPTQAHASRPKAQARPSTEEKPILKKTSFVGTFGQAWDIYNGMNKKEYEKGIAAQKQAQLKHAEQKDRDAKRARENAEKRAREDAEKRARDRAASTERKRREVERVEAEYKQQIEETDDQREERKGKERMLGYFQLGAMMISDNHHN